MVYWSPFNISAFNGDTLKLADSTRKKLFSHHFSSQEYCFKNGWMVFLPIIYLGKKQIDFFSNIWIRRIHFGKRTKRWLWTSFDRRNFFPGRKCGQTIWVITSGRRHFYGSSRIPPSFIHCSEEFKGSVVACAREARIRQQADVRGAIDNYAALLNCIIHAHCRDTAQHVLAMFMTLHLHLTTYEN